MNSVDITERCRFSERRIVYIVMGLINSGKTTRTTKMAQEAEDQGLKAVICSSSSSTTLSPECKADFNAALGDPSVRRIFIDGCNLWEEEREYYKNACEQADIEWIYLLVGRFTNASSSQYLQYNNKGYSEADYKQQLRLWGSYYRKEVLDKMETIRNSLNYEVRAMKDTRIVGTRLTPNGREVVLGLEPDGSFIRGYLFQNPEEGQGVFDRATMTGYRVAKSDKAIKLDGRDYKASYTPLKAV